MKTKHAFTGGVRMTASGRAGLFAAGVLFACLAAAAAGKPNVVVFMADDLGYADVSFNGGTAFRTPNIDALARGGVRFTDAHVSASVCSPSRAGFVTGRYQQRFGHEANCPPRGQGMDTGERTVGQAFREIGYRTGIFGKWHLGDRDDQYPTARGFDVFCGMREGGRGYWYNPNGDDRPGDPHAAEVNGKQVRFEGHYTDWLGAKGIAFLRECAAGKKPFFAFFSFNAPHTPHQSKPEDIAALGMKPTDRKANYYGLIHGLDRNIGLVMKALKDLDLLGSTMVWFLSDNGGTPASGNNAPLSGFKGIKLEGGQRVPFVLNWPGRTAPGAVYSNMVSSLDIFPTSLAACGGDPGRQPRQLDGVDILPYVTGAKKGVPHARLFWRKEEGAAVRDGDWKLVRTPGIPPLLYNVREDIRELDNRAEREPGRVEAMQKMLSDWEKGLVAPLWGEGRYWAKVRKGDYEKHLKRAAKRDGDAVWSWAAAGKYETDGFPSLNKKAWISGRDDAKREALLKEIRRIRGLPAEEVKAFPAAADFPGIPADGTPMVSRSAPVDPDARKWQSTGLYAFPGVPVTVTIDAPGRVDEIRIGCHTDRLSPARHKMWTRLPEISFSWKTGGRGALRVASPVGGLIYVTAARGAPGGGPVRVSFSPVADAPRYVLGKTSPGEWARQMKALTVPWGEIETPRLVMTLPLGQLKECPDIEACARCLQRNMSLQDWLIGWDAAETNKNPMRFVVDRQISAGGGHSGYPAMGGLGWGRPIAKGTLPAQGSWGLWHELGHNHQKPPFRFKGFGEVTVNLFSLLCQTRGCNVPREKAWGGLRPGRIAKEKAAYLAGGKNFLQLDGRHGLRLQFFAELIDKVGYGAFRKTALAYRASPYPGNTPDAARWDFFYVELCRAGGRDLTGIFDEWRVPLSDAARAGVRAMRLPAGD